MFSYLEHLLLLLEKFNIAFWQDTASVVVVAADFCCFWIMWWIILKVMRQCFCIELKLRGLAFYEHTEFLGSSDAEKPTMLLLLLILVLTIETQHVWLRFFFLFLIFSFGSTLVLTKESLHFHWPNLRCDLMQKKFWSCKLN